MKKLLVLLCISIFAVSASAYQKGENYISPTLGYHFFDSDHELENSAELGLRLGRFLSEDYSIEIEGAFARTENERTKDSVTATTLSLNSLMHFKYTEKIRPYIFLGVGGMFHEDNHAGVLAGLGLRLAATEQVSFDLRIKDMFMTKSRNDIVTSLSLNFAFGKASPSKAEPAASEKKSEEEPAAAAKSERKRESNANADSDNDGVLDVADSCPNTPAGYAVGPNGCVIDSDKDGVYDHEDRCPKTPKGMEVNSAGCAKAVPLHVNFENNSAKIDKAYCGNIAEFAKFVKAKEGVKLVVIAGHTDNKGSAAYNKILSQKRADAIRNVLIKKHGIKASMIKAKGYGEEKPLFANDSAENMFKNRRIEAGISY